MHGHAGLHQVAGDLALKVGKGQHQIGLHRQDAFDLCAGETADLGLFLARPGRVGGEAGDTGDAAFLTQEVKHLDGFGGQANDALGQSGHGCFRKVKGGCQRGKGDGQA